jgi:Zn-dependent protease
MFSGFDFVPAVWIGLVLLVLLHEAGHALMVKKAGGLVQQIEVLPFGGRCTWYGNVTPLERACIAFAGIWMQLLLLVAANLFLAFFGRSLSVPAHQFFTVFTSINLLLIAFNLLPVAPFDGEEAWRLFPLVAKKVWRGGRSKALDVKAKRLQAKLDALEGKPETAASKKTYLN